MSVDPSRTMVTRASLWLRRLVALGSLLGIAACNAPEPPGSTGGTDVPAGPCGRGLAVVSTDYQSTNVSLLGLDGEVLSSSFVSSATTSAALTAPLSGDVALPTMPNGASELLLVDRYPASVLTWITVADGTVRGQLNVSTGFAANPQDYLAVSATQAYVTRYEANRQPGAQPFDAGSDLLRLDPSARVIVGRVDLASALAPTESDFQPHPNRMVLVGDWLFVLVAAYRADYLDSAPSRLVTIDVRSDELVARTLLDGLHGCAGLAVRHDGGRIAVSCSGKFGGTATPSLAESGVVVLEVAGDPHDAAPPALVEVGRWAAAELDERPPGFSVDFAPNDRLLVATMGHFGVGGEPDVPDALVELDLGAAAGRLLRTTASLPFELGELRCTLPCASCFVADAERGVVTQLEPGADGWLAVGPDIVVDTDIGLPPRGLGRF